MSEWFLDASVFLALLEPDNPEHEPSMGLLADDTVATLEFALYETANVTVRAWRRPDLAAPARLYVSTVERDGQLLRVDEALIAAAAQIADEYGITAYDAAYAAGAQRKGMQLVSCDVKDLVEPGLAITPAQAVAARASGDG